jgi:hypothetical protein
VSLAKLLDSVELLGIADDALKRLRIRTEVVDDDSAVLAEI